MECPFPFPAVWTYRCVLSIPISMDVQGVPLSTTSGVNVQDVFQSIASYVDVQGIYIPFAFLKSFLNFGTPDWPVSGQSGTGMNKNVDTGTRLVTELGEPSLVPD